MVAGLQRLATFYRFVDNRFRLIGLGSSKQEPSHPLEGKSFKELPIKLQERIADTPLTMYILDSNTPERARLDIFERVNSGEPLTRQQMRNALYSGPATGWLRKAAFSPGFKKATGHSLDSKTMRDREAINRFCAFKLLPMERYHGGMDVFLAKGLAALSNCSEEERKKLRTDFDAVLDLNAEHFRSHAFRKSLASGISAPRSAINVSLFEVCTVALTGLPQLSEIRKDYLRNGIIELLHGDDFVDAVTYSTNGSRQVRKRFGMMRALVDEMADREQ